MKRDNSMILDPNIFISKPFLKCPHCNKADTFGVSWISGNGYLRRCRECRFTQSYKLPKIKKKIIYFDQFVISEMMKAINKKLGKTEKCDRFWLALFEKVDRLLQLQLIICPDSTFHQDESALYEFEAHRNMYEHLSNGTSFYDAGTIRRFQIADYFRQSIRGEKQPVLRLEVERVVSRDPNKWQGRIRLSINFKIEDSEKLELIKTKDKFSDAILRIFERWKNEKERNFRDWFLEEGMAFGQAIVGKYYANLSKYYQISIGKFNANAEEIFEIVMADENILILELQKYFRGKEDQKSREEKKNKILDLILSDKMLEIPSIRISALLWAALADQSAHGGRNKTPSSGIMNDIRMVSTLLPYCDVIFIDREVHGLLKHPKVKKDMQGRYKTKIYSAANKEEFIEYLDSIEKTASKEHLEKVKEVYGNDWPKPFLEMYET
jgi:hypothetical protein